MYQLRDGFRFGTDTVLLAWFTASLMRKGRKAACLELGANCGAATLLLAARREDAVIDALEIDTGAYEVLKRNIDINGLDDTVKAYNGDVRDIRENIRSRQYDIVFTNPPFYKAGAGPVSNVTGRSEENGCLEDFISAGSSRLIPSSGIMSVVMTARRADEVMELMVRYQVKPFIMMPVYPSLNKNAQIVLIAGRKTNNSTQLEIMPPLILNDKEQMDHIYNGEHEDCFI